MGDQKRQADQPGKSGDILKENLDTARATRPLECLSAVNVNESRKKALEITASTPGGTEQLDESDTLRRELATRCQNAAGRFGSSKGKTGYLGVQWGKWGGSTSLA